MPLVSELTGHLLTALGEVWPTETNRPLPHAGPWALNVQKSVAKNKDIPVKQIILWNLHQHLEGTDDPVKGHAFFK